VRDHLARRRLVRRRDRVLEVGNGEIGLGGERLGELVFVAAGREQKRAGS